MKRLRYPAEFKAESVKQVTERGHGVVDVAKRLGASDKSLYLWVQFAKEQSSTGGAETSQLRAEVYRVKAEFKRANEERDILKRPLRTLPSCPGEVRIYGRAPRSVSAQQHVPRSARTTQWL